jgi:hypothetical protein
MSRNPTNGSLNARLIYRRGHRWLGVCLAAFILILALTGIALNHAVGLKLDQRYVSWPWLLDLYGVRMPEPSKSYVDEPYRATQIGDRLFVDGRDTGQPVAGLAGIVALEPLLLVAGAQTAHVFTTAGERVEAFDLGMQLPGPIERIGRTQGRAVILSGGSLYSSDPDITMFEPAEGIAADAVDWSLESALSADDVATLEAAYRGRGIPVERVLLDLHSGRILGASGRLFMDIIAVCLVLLSLSGLILFRRRNRRENGGTYRNGDG